MSNGTPGHGAFVTSSPAQSPCVIGFRLYEVFRKGKSIETNLQWLSDCLGLRRGKRKDYSLGLRFLFNVVK